MAAPDLQNFLSQVDVQALKSYVTADGKAGGAAQGDTTVLLGVSHSNLKAEFMEIRFDRHMTIERVKERLMSHTGTSPSAMVLQLKDNAGRVVAALDDPSKKLGYFSPEDGWVIHVIDNDPFSVSKGGWLENVDLVQKYEISEEDYNKRDKSYRKFKEEKLREDPNWSIEKEMAMKRGVEYKPPKVETATDPEFMADLAATMCVGQRCEVDPGAKRGEVKFVGQAKEGLPMGYWIGVQYDEPVGKNDGSVKGVRYFECPAGYGGMVRPNKLKVGDYPSYDDLSDPDEI